MSNELYHYGVQGMKWGVRRFQNEDGTLTSAGRQRYSTSSNTTRSSGGRGRETHVTGQGKDVYKRGEGLSETGPHRPVGQNWHRDRENGTYVVDNIKNGSSTAINIKPGQVAVPYAGMTDNPLPLTPHYDSDFPFYDPNNPGVSNGLMPVADLVIESIEHPISNVPVNDLPSNTVSHGQQAANGVLATHGSTLLSGIKDVVSNAGKAVAEALTKAKDAVVDTAKKAGNAVKETGKKAASAISSLFKKK